MAFWRKPKVITVEVPSSACDCAAVRALAEAAQATAQRALELASNPQAQLDRDKAASRAEAERRRGQFRGA